MEDTATAFVLAAPTDPAGLPVKAPGEWNQFEIKAQGQTYDVTLNGVHITNFVNPDNNRGLPSSPNKSSFVGLQTHTGRVSFRNVQLKQL